jgi:hypothetical protein
MQRQDRRDNDAATQACKGSNQSGDKAQDDQKESYQTARL